MARLVVIALAVAIPIIGWIGVEYWSLVRIAPPSAVLGKTLPMTSAPGKYVNADSAAAQRRQSALRAETSEENMGQRQFRVPPAVDAIHKCRVDGRIIYSDMPCAAGSAIKILTSTVARASPVGERRGLEQTRESAVVPPAKLPLTVARDIVVAQSAPDETPLRAMECRKIDEQIAAIDARLRQPYQAQEGDGWKERRKKLNDRRFSLGC